MYLTVARYEKKCGKYEVKLPFWRILREDLDSYIEDLEALLNDGVRSLVLLAVECKDGIVDYAEGYVKYPNLGLKRHISLIVTNEKFGTVRKRQYVENLKRFLEDEYD